MSKIELPTLDELSTYYIELNEPIHVDWQAITAKDPDNIELHLPAVTEEILKDANFKIGEDETVEEAIERFENSESFWYWKDDRFPVMNYLWPCEPLSCFVPIELAVSRLYKFAPDVTLVTVQDLGPVPAPVQGLALSAGGMDLSWEIAAAYVCCGHIPPSTILFRLPHMVGSRLDPLKALIVKSLDRVADHYTRQAQRARRERKNLWGHLTRKKEKVA